VLFQLAVQTAFSMKLKKILIFGLGSVLLAIPAILLMFYRATGSFELAVPAEITGEASGDLVAVTRIGKYPTAALRYALSTVELDDTPAIDYGITLYQLLYRTTQFDGSQVIASGLLTVPNRPLLPSVIAYFHGTNTDRSTAPSQPGLGEGLLVSAAAAGSGHVLIAPDYIGLGESYELHPYLYTETTVSTSIDMLKAARSWLQHLGHTWPEAFFLMGVSQGGHATFAVQRELEKTNNPLFKVTATAPMAGPFQILNIGFPQALTGETDSHELYLGYLTSAYAAIYGQPLNSILMDDYARAIPPVFDGDTSSGARRAALPDLPRDMFRPEFLALYEAGQRNWFLDALEENSVFNWTPKAPVRLYYGDNDVDVLPREALDAATTMARRGADITAISLGALGHDESFLSAIPQAIVWFSELASAQ